MRRHLIATGVLAASFAWAATAFGAGPDAAAPVAIRVYDTTALSAVDLAAAQATAEAVLRSAGLAPEWAVCGRGAADAADDPCDRTMRSGELAIRIVRVHVPDRYRGTLPMGDAFVDVDARSGSLATMYLDRVQWLASASGADALVVLGRAMAHEVGHLLLGTNAHARAGLMRARWTAEELQRRHAEDWRFTGADARTMRGRATLVNASASLNPKIPNPKSQ